MPYISQDRRVALDFPINKIIEECRGRDLHFMQQVIREIVRGAYASNEGTLPCISDLLDIFDSIDFVKGDVNYTVCRVALGAMKPDAGWGYTTLSNVIGVIREVAKLLRDKDGLRNEPVWVCEDIEYELRRRLLDGYENQAILRNGDVPEIEIEDFAQ